MAIMELEGEDKDIDLSSEESKSIDEKRDDGLDFTSRGGTMQELSSSHQQLNFLQLFLPLFLSFLFLCLLL